MAEEVKVDPVAGAGAATPLAAVAQDSGVTLVSGAADPAPAPKPGATLVDMEAPKDAPASTDAWPEGLMERLSAGDKARGNIVSRFKSVDALVDKIVEQEKLIRSGSVKKSLPDNATAEQVAEWRKANNVPETAEGYDLKLAEGLVLGGEDKPAVDAWLAKAHARNMDADTASAVVNDYLAVQSQLAQEVAERDAAFMAESKATLQQAFGGNYTANMNAIKTLMATAPSGIGQRLLEGRTADGTVVGNDPAVLQWLVEVASQVQPRATLAPGGKETNVADELARIDEVRRKDPDSYWRDLNMQKRYGELLGQSLK